MFRKVIIPSTLILFLLCFFSKKESYATHVIGGELCYECVDPTTYVYNLKFAMYRDCYNGVPAFDNPIYIGVYERTSGKLINGPKGFNIPFTGSDTLVNETYDVCLFSPPDICSERALYERQALLPPIPGGYDLLMIRCCRNISLTNIAFPNATGACWISHIPDTAIGGCNSSPCFISYPSRVICSNKRIDFDHSASDKDGDSLVYEMMWPNSHPAGIIVVDASAKSPDPFPAIPKVGYNGGYSYLDPFNVPGDPLTITSDSGRLTGTPGAWGQYVVGIAVKEYRNGIYIGTSYRDFQYNIAECDDELEAKLTWDFDTCQNIVTFRNITGDRGSFYFWDFDVTGLGKDTSTEDTPKHQYTEPGTYRIIFAVNPGESCADTLDTTIVITNPPVKADFYAGNACLGEEVRFVDQSFTTSSTGAINKWFWDFGDGTRTSISKPSPHLYESPGLYTVSLKIITEKGCQDSTTAFSKVVQIYAAPNPDAGPDQITVTGEPKQIMVEDIYETYLWSPPTFLNDDTIHNPISTPTQSITYSIMVTDSNGCEGMDSVSIEIRVPVGLRIPTAFTPNADGVNDYFFVYDTTGYQGAGLVDNSFEFRIFDRYGEMVFESIDVNIGWDGRNRHNNKDMETGVYVWVVNALYESGEKYNQNGNVSLIR